MATPLPDDYKYYLQIIVDILGEEINKTAKVEDKQLDLRSLVSVLKIWLFKSRLPNEQKKTLTKLFAHLFIMRIKTKKNSAFRSISFIEELILKYPVKNEQTRLLAEGLIYFIQNPELLEDQTDLNTVD